MAELNEYEWELNGLMLGAGTPYAVTRVTGLEDHAPVAVQSTDRSGDGRVTGRIRLRDRPVRMEIGGHTWSASERDALRVAVTVNADRRTGNLLRWRHAGQVTKRALVEPVGNPITLPGDEGDLVYQSPLATVNLEAPDPVVYSDAVTNTSFGAETKTIVNAGAVTAVSPGALWWEITAGGGGCTNPSVTHADHTGEKWLLAATLTSGQVVSVGTDRVTRIGTVMQSATVRGAGGAPCATWPSLRPGDNDITFACTAGSFTAVLHHRSTW